MFLDRIPQNIAKQRVTGAGVHFSLQNIAFAGLTRKIFFSKNLADGAKSLPQALGLAHDRIFGLWMTRSDVTWGCGKLDVQWVDCPPQPTKDGTRGLKADSSVVRLTRP